MGRFLMSALQAIADMLDDSSQERRVDQRKIREMRHAADVRYVDFTPVMIIALASVIGARDLAIGTGDTKLYLFAGMRAAVVISIRVPVPGGGEGELTHGRPGYPVATGL